MTQNGHVQPSGPLLFVPHETNGHQIHQLTLEWRNLFVLEIQGQIQLRAGDTNWIAVLPRPFRCEAVYPRP